MVSAAAWPLVQVPGGSGAQAQTALYRPVPTLPLPEAPPAVPDAERVSPAPPGSGRGAAPGCSVYLLSASACEPVGLRVAAICYHVSRHNFASLTSTKHVGEVCRVPHPASSWLSCSPSCPEGLKPWLGGSQEESAVGWCQSHHQHQ